LPNVFALRLILASAEVLADATYRFCPARLCGISVPVTPDDASEDSGAPASGGRIQTDGPSALICRFTVAMGFRGPQEFMAHQ
jgi:hypothetical protein